jgi:hypothetical protein
VISFKNVFKYFKAISQVSYAFTGVKPIIIPGEVYLEKAMEMSQLFIDASDLKTFLTSKSINQITTKELKKGLSCFNSVGGSKLILRNSFIAVILTLFMDIFLDFYTHFSTLGKEALTSKAFYKSLFNLGKAIIKLFLYIESLHLSLQFEAVLTCASLAMSYI